MLIRFSLYGNDCYVLHGLDMANCNTVMAVVTECSYGAIVLDVVRRLFVCQGKNGKSEED